MINYAILSMMRSGHHAIIEWISSLTNSTILFHNNYLYEDKTYILGKKDSKQKVRLINFEDITVEEFSNEINSISVKYNQVFLPVIVVRNPFNTFASRWSHTSSYITVNEQHINIWIGHAKEILNETNKINNLVGIYFDHWFRYAHYRLTAARSLGLNSTSKPFMKVANYGGGSSFDGLRYDGNATSMNVLNRWSELNDKNLNQIVSQFPECSIYLKILEKNQSNA